MPRPFKSELIIEERISDITLKAYHVGFDQNVFRLQPLVDIIRSVIPEFSLGYYASNSAPSALVIERIKEAAETVYTTDKYQKRGEFGELILHLLLRDFQNSIPLVSKIYFKDSYNVPVHGFDGVHVTVENGIKKLWLGESKLYKKGTRGIQELVKDVIHHVNEDYLRKEFLLISRKLPEKVPEIEFWRELMDKHQTLDKIYSSIVIPLVCTYTSDLFATHNSDNQAYVDDFKKECEDLLKEFTDKNPVTNVEIILMLLPVPSKDVLNKELDKRLKAMQSI